MEIQYVPQKTREQILDEMQYRRAKTVVAEVMGFQKIEDSQNLSAWNSTVEYAVQSPNDNPSVYKLTQKCYQYVNEHIFVPRKPGETDFSYQQEVAKKRKEYFDEIYQYMGVKEPEWKHAVILAEHTRFGKRRENGKEVIDINELDEYVLEEIPLNLDPRTGHAIDVVKFICKKDIDPKKRDLVIQEIKNQWSFFRDKSIYPEGFEIPFTFVSSKDRQEAARSCCYTGVGKNPSVLVDGGYNNDVRGTTIHEMIHALFFAQAGNKHILSDDFIEGVTTFFTDLQVNVNGGANSLVGATEFSKRALKAANLRTGQLIGSHTHLLKKAANNGYSMEADQKEYTYLVGHAIVQAIFESPRFKNSMSEAIRRGSNPYTMLISLHGRCTVEEIRRIYGYDAQTFARKANKNEIKFRDIIDKALEDVGFTVEERNSIKLRTNTILKEVSELL